MTLQLRKVAVPILLLLTSTASICASAFSTRPLHTQSKLLPSSQYGVDSLEHTPSDLLFNRRWGNQGPVSMSSLSEGGEAKSTSSFKAKVGAFASGQFFQIGMIFAVSLARAFPHLGKNGGLLRPELFIGKFGVTLVFLLSGLSVKLTDLTEAITNYKLNGLIQLASFGAWPFLVGVPVTRFLETFLPGLIPKPLLDGLLIMTCLPTTINMCFMLTDKAGGSVPAALCNAVISNISGIFITPALLLRFFGASIDLPVLEMIVKLCKKVLLPVAIGQALRATPSKEVHDKNKKLFKRLQELVLLGIVWNAFCNAFTTAGMGLDLKHTVALGTLLSILHTTSLAALFAFFKSKVLKFSEGQVVAAMFCASQKTLAFGLPLITTMFEGNPNLTAFCAPIMLMHPLQLLIGTVFGVPKLRKYTGNSDGGDKN